MPINHLIIIICCTVLMHWRFGMIRPIAQIHLCARLQHWILPDAHLMKKYILD